jgi:integrase
MRVFKATYKDRKGKARESSKWYVEFKDHNEAVRRLPAFTDRGESERLGRNLEELVACRINGERPDKELRKRLSLLPSRLRDKLIKLGLLRPEIAAASKTLARHIDDFEAALKRKNNSAGHVSLTVKRVRTLFEGCGFNAWSDVEGEAIERWLEKRREAENEPDPAKGKCPRKPKRRTIGMQTTNYYVGAAKQFCKWMVRERRATESPLEHLGRLNAADDRRHDRRALSVDEVRRLLTVAHNGSESYGMPGTERRLLYVLALQSGLRANELRSLTRSSFDFRLKPATVTVEAGSSKRRRRDTLPLRVDTAAELHAHLAAKHPGAPAFCLPPKYDMADMLQVDLDTARAAWLKEPGTVEEKARREQSSFLRYVDEAGRYADFHSLRHTFLTNLARSGVHPKVAQALARHSTITLTMDRYSHTVLGEQSEAVEALPDLGPATVEAMRATGTDDAAALSAMKLSAGDAMATSEREQAQRIDAQQVEHTGMQQGREGVLTDCLAERVSVKVEEADDAQDAGISDLDSVLAFCLAFSGEKLAVNAPLADAPNGDAESAEKPVFSAVLASEKGVRLSGLEPETYGLKVRCSTD